MKLSLCRNKDCQNIFLPAKECCRCTRTDFTEIGPDDLDALHDRARSAYEDARNQIVARNFDAALRLLDIAKQWSPRESGVYFYRLLAKNGCTFEGDLLMHGFDSRPEIGDPDFIMAQRLASTEEEAKFYSTLAQANAKICELLTESEGTAFKQELSQMEEKIRGRAPAITKMQEELQQLQQSLMENALEQADLLQELEHAVKVSRQIEVTEASVALNKIKQEIVRSDVKKLETDDVHAFYIRMAAASCQLTDAEHALSEIEAHHPWLETLEKLKQQQQELEQAISDKKSQILQSDEDLVHMQDDYQSLQENYARVMKALREYRFSDAVFHGSEHMLIQTVYEQTGIQKDYLAKKQV